MIGVVGLGYWGPNLIRNFARNPQAEVRGVCDRLQPRVTRVVSEYRIAMATTNAVDLFGSRDIDLVVIATPSDTHYGLAKAAIAAGKHVLVMKPLATRAEHAEELCDLAERPVEGQAGQRHRQPAAGAEGLEQGAGGAARLAQEL